MNYFRRWVCEVCEKTQTTIDTPRIKVCDRCAGAAYAIGQMQQVELERVLHRAYERGYVAGKKVARAELGVNTAEAKVLHRFDPATGITSQHATDDSQIRRLDQDQCPECGYMVDTPNHAVGCPDGRGEKS